MTTRKIRKGTGGFTLIEMLIATTVFGVIIGAALGFMTVQNRTFNEGSDRLFMLQNLRYASQALEMDLRTLGSNVPVGQPSMILADDDVIAFSADHTSNVLDYSAVFFDPDAPDGMVQAPRTAVSLPNSSYSWPDTVYESLGGAPSGAELIIFSFHSDTSTARTDDFVLMRQVNDSTPEVLARNLLNQGSTPFFRYFRRRVYTGVSSLDSIPDDEVPLFHWEPIHGSAGDTAMSAKTDSIRAVRVSLRATNGRTGDGERFVDISRVFDLPNAGIEIAGACGDEPILDSDLRLLLGGGGGLSEAATQEAIDVFQDLADKQNTDPGLVDVLEDMIALLEDALVELNKNPPDLTAAVGKIEAARDKLQQAYDDGLINLGQTIQLMKLFKDIGVSIDTGLDDEDGAISTGGPFYVAIRWDQSVDEESGEEDVVRYLVYRRDLAEGSDWGNPIVSIPAGSDTYMYDDVEVEAGHTYQYVHAAQDCTPTLSPLSAPQEIKIQ